MFLISISHLTNFIMSNSITKILSFNMANNWKKKIQLVFIVHLSESSNVSLFFHRIEQNYGRYYQSS